MASIFLSPRLILKAIFPSDPIHPGEVRLRKLDASENNKKELMVLNIISAHLTIYLNSKDCWCLNGSVLITSRKPAAACRKVKGNLPFPLAETYYGFLRKTPSSHSGVGRNPELSKLCRRPSKRGNGLQSVQTSPEAHYTGKSITKHSAHQ